MARAGFGVLNLLMGNNPYKLEKILMVWIKKKKRYESGLTPISAIGLARIGYTGNALTGRLAGAKLFGFSVTSTINF